MTQTHTAPATTNTGAATERNFHTPAAVAEDLSFAIEAGDPDVLLATFQRYGLRFDTFTSTETGFDLPEGLPPIRVATVAFPDGPELMLVLPEKAFTEADAAELVIRILASGKPYPDGCALMVTRPEGGDLTLFGGFDRSGESPDTFVFGFRADELKAIASSSNAIH